MSMNKHKRQNKRFNRAVLLTTILTILIFGSVSTTIAFLITGTDSITNIFVPANVETTVVMWKGGEGYDGIRCRVRNESDISAYIRAAVVVNWVKTDGAGNRHIHAIAPEEGVDYQIEFNTQNWIKAEYPNEEVIYYAKEPVGPCSIEGGEKKYSTDYALFNNFKQISTVNQPDGYELEVEVVASGIQSVPYGVVSDKWNVTVVDGTITHVSVPRNNSN